MSDLKMWAISQMIGDGTPETNPYRPALSDDFPEIKWVDILVAAPPYIPAVAISRTINDDVTGTAIHQAARSLILAAEEWVDEAWVDYIYSGANFGPEQPFASWHWTQVRNGVVGLGVDAQVIDDWKTANSDATKVDFYHALRNLLTGQEK